MLAVLTSLESLDLDWGLEWTSIKAEGVVILPSRAKHKGAFLPAALHMAPSRAGPLGFGHLLTARFFALITRGVGDGVGSPTRFSLRQSVLSDALGSGEEIECALPQGLGGVLDRHAPITDCMAGVADRAAGWLVVDQKFAV